MAPDGGGPHRWEEDAPKLWLGVMLGMVLGLGIAIARRRTSTRAAAPECGARAPELFPDFAAATLEIRGRTKAIEDGARAIAHDAEELWTHGRRLLNHSQSLAS